MFLYIIPFENLDQFILKFGFIYLATKLNVLSSIDATRWKLDLNPLKNYFTSYHLKAGADGIEAK